LISARLLQPSREGPPQLAWSAGKKSAHPHREAAPSLRLLGQFLCYHCCPCTQQGFSHHRRSRTLPHFQGHPLSSCSECSQRWRLCCRCSRAQVRLLRLPPRFQLASGRLHTTTRRERQDGSPESRKSLRFSLLLGVGWGHIFGVGQPRRVGKPAPPVRCQELGQHAQPVALVAPKRRVGGKLRRVARRPCRAHFLTVPLETTEVAQSRTKSNPMLVEAVGSAQVHGFVPIVGETPPNGTTSGSAPVQVVKQM